MLGIDPKAARAAWTVFLVALLIIVTWAARGTLVVFAVALFLAYMLSPLVDLVERFTRSRLSRTPALAVVYVVITCLLVLLGATVGARIGSEASSLAAQLPGLLMNPAWTAQIPLPQWLESERGNIAGWLQQAVGNGSNLVPYLKAAGAQVFSGAKYLLYIVLVPILSFFFLKDGPGIIVNAVAGIGDGNRREVVQDILDDVSLLLGQYIRALVILSMCTFVAYSLFLGITGAPYTVLLAGFAAACELIPVIGPLGAGVVVIFVGGFSGYGHILWFVLFWVLYRLFQDYVVSPYLMGHGVKLNPLLVLFGVLAGEQIAGVAGMFFSVPAIATLRVVFVRLQRAQRHRVGFPHSVE